MNRPDHVHRAAIVPGAYDRRFFSFFGWYVRRLMRKRFFAVRLLQGGRTLLAEASAHAGPLIVSLNHPSWWDPLVCVLLHELFMPSRFASGPMDRRELERFKFMRKLGLFGVDPDDSHVLQPMSEHVAQLFRAQPRGTFWITSQGHFSDVRDELTIRPGVSAVAAALAGGHASGAAAPRVLALAVEYAFWTDQRPELFMRVDIVEAPDRSSVPSWHRAITRAMQAGAASLATAVRAREPAAFDTLIGGETKIHPVYDLWLRLRGKGSSIGSADGGGP